MVKELVKSLRQKSYELFCEMRRLGSFDIRQVDVWSRLLTPRMRREVKTRLLAYLIYQHRCTDPQRRTDWKTFLTSWYRLPVERREEEIKIYRKEHLPQGSRSMHWLMTLVLKDGMPSKGAFTYIWAPVQGRIRERMLLCWYSYARNGCGVVQVIKRGREAMIASFSSGDQATLLFYY